jgi:hypothetical protein
MSDNFSFELLCSGGVLWYTNSLLSPFEEFDYAVLPELKFNFKDFSVGIEYMLRRESQYNQVVVKQIDKERLRLHSIGLSIGYKFRRIARKDNE